MPEPVRPAGCGGGSGAERLRRSTRPRLKPGYLARRRVTEAWLWKAAQAALGRSLPPRPAYFFLGDFTYQADISRPSALVLPLSEVAPDALTFTLGDSMSVAEGPDARVLTLAELRARFASGTGMEGFAFSDREGWVRHFVEAQVWSGSDFWRADE